MVIYLLIHHHDSISRLSPCWAHAQIRERGRATSQFWSLSKKLLFSPPCLKGILHLNKNLPHPLSPLPVTSLLVWVQEIRFKKQSGAANRLKCALQPRRRTVCAPVNCWSSSLQLHSALWVNISLIWNDLPVFLLVPKLFLITERYLETCICAILS